MTFISSNVSTKKLHIILCEAILILIQWSLRFIPEATYWLEVVKKNSSNTSYMLISLKTKHFLFKVWVVLYIGTTYVLLWPLRIISINKNESNKKNSYFTDVIVTQILQYWLANFV